MKSLVFNLSSTYLKLLSGDIFYAPTSAQFYAKASSDINKRTLQELPSNVNRYLTLLVDESTLKSDLATETLCIGRYSDLSESDENDFFIYEGYRTIVIPIPVADFDEQYSEPLSKPAFAPSRLLNALDLAANSHALQKRKSDGHPYINHLIEVSSLLISAGVTDEDIIFSGLLHDVIEDYCVTKLDLIKAFGTSVANMVDCLTDDKSKSLGKRRAHTLSNLDSYPQAVKTTKFADIYSNIPHIPPHWTQDNKREYLKLCDTQFNILKTSNKYLLSFYKSARAKFI